MCQQCCSVLGLRSELCACSQSVLLLPMKVTQRLKTRVCLPASFVVCVLLKGSVGYKWVPALGIFVQVICQRLKYHLCSYSEVNLWQAWEQKGCVDTESVAVIIFP